PAYRIPRAGSKGSGLSTWRPRPVAFRAWRRLSAAFLMPFSTTKRGFLYLPRSRTSQAPSPGSPRIPTHDPSSPPAPRHTPARYHGSAARPKPTVCRAPEYEPPSTFRIGSRPEPSRIQRIQHRKFTRLDLVMKRFVLTIIFLALATSAAWAANCEKSREYLLGNLVGDLTRPAHTYDELFKVCMATIGM